MSEIVYLCKSNKPDKKYMVKIDNKTIHFGAANMSDYRIHKNKDRKQNYIIRHQKRENWTKSGLKTAGFWSRWLLWGETTLSSSIKVIENKFKIKIIKCNKQI